MKCYHFDLWTSRYICQLFFLERNDKSNLSDQNLLELWRALARHIQRLEERWSAWRYPRSAFWLVACIFIPSWVRNTGIYFLKQRQRLDRHTDNMIGMWCGSLSSCHRNSELFSDSQNCWARFMMEQKPGYTTEVYTFCWQDADERGVRFLCY